MDPKAFPNSLQAEQAILGTVLLDPQTYILIGEKISPDDFFKTAHGVIWQAVKKVVKDGRNPDATEVIDRLTLAHELDVVGGATYVMELLDHTCVPVIAEQYVDIIKAHSLRRQLILNAHKIAKAARTEEAPDSVAATAIQSLLTTVEDRDEPEARPAADIVTERLAKTKEALEREESSIGIPSGYDKLDELTLGFHGGNYIVVAARPGMGKSAFALSLSLNATRKDRSVAFVSLEMSEEQMADRLMAMESGVSMQNIRRGDISEYDVGRLEKGARNIQPLPLYISVQTRINIDGLRMFARRMKMRNQCDMLIIDYLQLVMPRKGFGNREQAVADMSRTIKAIALELDIPIIALAQLNRQVDGRASKRPILSDLRESGSIEQDADAVMFLYRDEVYDPNTQDKGKAEVIVAKQRNGPTGIVTLDFDAERNIFKNENPYIPNHSYSHTTTTQAQVWANRYGDDR
jgi:replicative DNA helicase